MTTKSIQSRAKKVYAKYGTNKNATCSFLSPFHFLNIVQFSLPYILRCILIYIYTVLNHLLLFELVHWYLVHTIAIRLYVWIYMFLWQSDGIFISETYYKHYVRPEHGKVWSCQCVCVCVCCVSHMPILIKRKIWNSYWIDLVPAFNIIE